jgi:23S rRNA (adenine2503-C2)-methyltransferase
MHAAGTTPAAGPRAPAAGGPLNLFGLDRAGLAEVLAPVAPRTYQAAQVHRWMYARLATGFETMTDLPGPLRSALAERFRIAWPGVRETRRSDADGSTKYVLGLDDGLEVEAVFIPHGRRVTLCLSSQAGCALKCRFCLTGTMGLQRHLSPGEILGQAAVLARAGGLRPNGYRIVFMGMGEPLHNYDAVMTAFRVLTDPDGFGLAPRRVTLSTVGLVPAIDRLARESPRPRLAVSLAAGHDALRDDLMPINRTHDLESLMSACRRFPLAPRERITFEYVLLEGVNDSETEARRLARALHGIRSKVNVIPYNEAGVPGFRTPSPERAGRFRDALLDLGVPASIRWSRGRDIGAACGQLVRQPTPAAPAP